MTTEKRSRPDRILIASCNSQHYEQTLWPHVVSRQGAAFVWAGDAIYGDDFEPIPEDEQTKPKGLLDRLHPMAGKRVRDATPKILHDLYAEQLQHPGYRTLIGKPENQQEQAVVVMGTFDDHDYGRNNGDRTYNYRLESAVAHMDFVERSNGWNTDPNVWAKMKQRAAEGKGVYGVKVLDFRRPRGQQLLTDEEAGLDPSTGRTTQLSDRSVAIFLLDCRSNKTPWLENNKEKKLKSELDYQGDFLGEEQWAWFEEAIGRSTATVNIVVQGLQVHPERYFDGHLIENWSRFPMAQHRLYQAVLKPNVQSPILVSGDVHMAEIMRRDCRRVSRRDDSELQTDATTRLLLEVTSSGMTHSWGSGICDAVLARPDEGWLCKSRMLQTAVKTGVHFNHISGACTDLLKLEKDQVQEGAKTGVQYALDKNFGEFEFDWENRKVLLRVLGEDPSEAPFLSSVWDFDTLSGRNPVNETGLVCSADYYRVFEDLSSHEVATDGDWICVNYRGYASERLQLAGVVSFIAVTLATLLLPLVLPLLLACLLLRGREMRLPKRKGKGPFH